VYLKVKNKKNCIINNNKMDFMTVIRTCLDFAIANDCSLQSFSEGVQKVGIDKRGERKEVYIERGKGDLWDIFSVEDGKTTDFPPVSSRDMLMSTLAGIWTWKRPQVTLPSPAVLPDEARRAAVPEVND
jgi:hypothetical protein